MKTKVSILSLSMLAICGLVAKAAPKTARSANLNAPANYRITFTEVAVESGFDPDAQWLMVPANGVNSVMADAENVYDESKDTEDVKEELNGPHPADVKYAYDATKIGVGVTRQDFLALLKINGKVVGDTSVSAKVIVGGNPTEAGKLDVSVKTKVTKTVNMFFMSDSTGKATTRSLSSAGPIIDALNTIYGKQANVTFVLGQAVEAQAREILGGPLVFPNPFPFTDDNFFSVTESPERFVDGYWKEYELADLNVFFVWTAAPSGKKGTIVGKATPLGTKAVVADQGDASVVAHEIGHNFGLPDLSEAGEGMNDYLYKKNLMKGVRDRQGSLNGDYLNKSQINAIPRP